MDYFPVFLDLKQRTCLLVGGGDVALRKARLLVKAGARLRVVALAVVPELQALVAQSLGELHLREYCPSDAAGCALVIAATDNEPLNAAVSRDAKALNVPVNVVDNPALCSYITPAIIDRSPAIAQPVRLH